MARLSAGMVLTWTPCRINGGGGTRSPRLADKQWLRCDNKEGQQRDTGVANTITRSQHPKDVIGDRRRGKDDGVVAAHDDGRTPAIP